MATALDVSKRQESEEREDREQKSRGFVSGPLESDPVKVQGEERRGTPVLQHQSLLKPETMLTFVALASVLLLGIVRGQPGKRDGSILIKNLDYNDNGTFTCDAKNPPDIVGRPSSVRLLVFETVPIQAGVITGAIIGVVLGLLVLIVVIYYLMRFLVARRVFSLSVRSVSAGGFCCQGLEERPEPIPGTDTCVAKRA
ncbi:hypothetical protein F7725_011108 [Dissostichus mawsoni]|uniref:Immunoglobulin V-set domain-containing protein n=1 Tax=Dissostichus mawsoni TaxID=36200 RepID=A0A7J5ZB70_DISMA|nr:hypothetical protein F7725_011108 [Dissostichus mawsoni]